MGQGTSRGLNRQGLARDRKDGEKKEKKFEPSEPPPRVGRKQRNQKVQKLLDYLLMEEEFVANQERLKPQEDKNEEDRSKVDDVRGTLMNVGNLEELIDENHVIVSSSVGPEYYSFNLFNF
ncbi:26S proteasome regulatory subunit 4-like protein [Thalictrum thalictroides]|uniref:26S proteasome regulatory subunit 4-like protein n=1 Tax=Thalictrum thalictroides TaxID=46969 RepID=A0A7J6WX26_THATH|nr:26S proteasome regulatory subunit 4-like protein [Thalictrum thalictroides]